MLPDPGSRAHALLLPRHLGHGEFVLPIDSIRVGSRLQHDHAAVSERRDGQLDGVHDGERGDVDAAGSFVCVLNGVREEVQDGDRDG